MANPAAITDACSAYQRAARWAVFLGLGTAIAPPAECDRSLAVPSEVPKT